MKAEHTFCCLFVVASFCVFPNVNASDDQDLLDFDFADLKEVDWNYNDGSDNVAASKETAMKSKVSIDQNDKNQQQKRVTFEDDFDEDENQVNPFNWRERVLRKALSKALTNKKMRQRFVEVMPILRVLSSQQRLALSALISAQVNARQGQQLKLEQVRMMFGNDRKLLLPIVYDIANLVRNSARNFLHFDWDDLVPASEYQQRQTEAERRNVELNTAEEADDSDDIGVVPISANVPDDDFSSLEDFFPEMPSDVLDPKRINEELQAPIEGSKPTTPPPQPAPTLPTPRETLTARRRRRRSAPVQTTEFVHKLIRSMPLSVNEDDLLRGAAGRTIRLNTTAFVLPQEGQSQQQNKEVGAPTPSSTAAPVTIVTPSATILPEDRIDSVASSVPSYYEIEDLAFAGLNGSEINLTSNTRATNSATEIESSNAEPLPSPEELTAGPRYRITTNNVHFLQPKMAIKRKRVQMRIRPKSQLPLPSKHAPVVVPPKKCERFTASMCIQTDDYPLDAIMGSIRRHKNAMTALLAEYHDNIGDIEFKDEFDDYPFHKKRREDGETGGSSGMCQSIVRYARPQKARSASGEWKYIVNTGQHTQTLRLEKCSNPQESCSYLAQSYRSHCSQVYNYHRLLSWDKMRGLHVDIFKVPTCCSCQIDGYRQQFPPLNAIKPKDFTPAINADLYSTINEDDLDYTDHEEDDDGLNYPNQYGTNSYVPQPHKRNKAHSSYDPDDHLVLSSNKVRTKPTVGTYLSPPGGDEYDATHRYKGARSSTPVPVANNLLQHVPRRRPYKSLQNEDRVDLEIAPSEQHTEKEVNYYGRNSAAQTPLVRTNKKQQRKRIYTVPIHTASPSTGTNKGGGGGSSSGGLVPTSPTGSIAAGGSSSSSGGGGINEITTAARPTYYTSSHNSNAQSNGHQNILAVAASLIPPTTSSTVAASSTSSAPSSSSTEPTYYASSAVPHSYHVNSIYSTKYGSGSGSISPKRINYSYHPIIDFFETNNKRALAAANSDNGDDDDDDDDDLELAASTSSLSSFSSKTMPSSKSSSSSSSLTPSVHPTLNTDLLYHQKIPKSTPVGVSRPPSVVYQSRERRIGYGAGAGAGATADENAWRPMVMES